MDINLAEGHCCLVTDDGTDLAMRTLQQLAKRGWNAVLLSLPESEASRRKALPEGTNQIHLRDWSEENLEACLAEVTHKFGPVAVFIHLNPICSECDRDGLHFSERGRLVVQEVFLIAKHLKEMLTAASLHGRAAFMTVTRLDGEFGLGDRNDVDLVSSGLFGLVKSLNLEWGSVFCRALDLDPDLTADDAVKDLIAELMDPNRRVVEVGYSSKGRATLALESIKR